MQFFTIIARNYLPYARVLARSLALQERGYELVTIVIDGHHDECDVEPFACLHLDDVVPSMDQRHRMVLYYDVMELATAIKPLVFQYLLKEHEVVVYLDPDIFVYSDLSELEALIRDRGLVLTPHSVEPMPRDGLRPTEAEILQSGVYNLGFLGLDRRSDAFLRWWWERLEFDAIVDPGRMMFTDQRWVDLAPGYFDTHLLKDPGYNVAYWNLFAREIVRADTGWLAAGRPLRFFHFSGYEPDKPWALSKHMGNSPRHVLADMPSVAQLCNDYGAQLVAQGYERSATVPYGYSFLPDGTPISKGMRRAIRSGAMIDDDAYPVPDPFSEKGSEHLIAWLKNEAPARRWRGISRFHYGLYDSRPDLQIAFPEHSPRAVLKFRRWTTTDPTAVFDESRSPSARVDTGSETILKRYVSRPIRAIGVGRIALAKTLRSEILRRLDSGNRRRADIDRWAANRVHDVKGPPEDRSDG
jgi:hypothetical protein